MKKMGFKYHYKTFNGGFNSLCLYAFTKKNVKHDVIKYKITVTNNIKKNLTQINKYPMYYSLETDRNSLLLYYNSLKICNVHLNIGYHLKRNSEELNKLIMKFNSILRINQLKSILTQQPDIIMGYCNFERKSEEHLFLEKQGYSLLNSDNVNSTPYNRVDNVYSKVKNIKSNNFLIKCNYSDHLPLFQELTY